jgi:cell wall-associated NlpC family hydrolase
MPKVNHADILAEARTWRGTPFHHQARIKGNGVDCAQLVVGVGQALGLIGEYPREYVRYGRVPRPDYMRTRLEEFMDEIPANEAVPGDVLWIYWRDARPDLPMHLAFFTDLHGRGILHAYEEAGRVVETALSTEVERRVDSWWRYRGVVD